MDIIQFIQRLAELYFPQIIIGLLALIVILSLLLFIIRLKCTRLRKLADRSKAEARTAVASAQEQLSANIATMQEEVERVRVHYQSEARRVHAEAHAALDKLKLEFEPLRELQGLCGEGVPVQQVLRESLEEATALRAQAHALLEQSRAAAAEERSRESQKAKGITQEANAFLSRATREAGRIVEEAHKQAEHIGGEAYVALRDKEHLEQAVRAIRNIIEGYGDRYIVPTRSLIDDLASDFGHTEAGQALSDAREHSRRMVEEGHAATCDYVETTRRDTAIRFVVDAFNGRVDAILTRSKHDNVGTLEQEIRDTFAIVNLNGKAFRDARILPAYLEARLAELRWAVIVQELKAKEREEQRRIKEQMREEEKARRDYERAVQESQREEHLIKKAIEKVLVESQVASQEQKAQYEAQLAELGQKLVEAEAKNRRAISMAQQTRRGNVYIISNLGSFGEGVFKIGMTRRLEPLDRVRELGDASVPFAFDVHAIVFSDDAPALENLLHTEFEPYRINKVNYRKEFFQLPVDKLRSFFADRAIQAAFTMTAEAHEYRETQALNKMTPEERERFHLRSKNGGQGWDSSSELG
jgi:hypothetical protein